MKILKIRKDNGLVHSKQIRLVTDIGQESDDNVGQSV